MKTQVHTEICTQIFIAALLTISQNVHSMNEQAVVQLSLGIPKGLVSRRHHRYQNPDALVPYIKRHTYNEIIIQS